MFTFERVNHFTLTKIFNNLYQYVPLKFNDGRQAPQLINLKEHLDIRSSLSPSPSPHEEQGDINIMCCVG